MSIYIFSLIMFYIDVHLALKAVSVKITNANILRRVRLWHVAK
jgi:hypothetical protein